MQKMTLPVFFLLMLIGFLAMITSVPVYRFGGYVRRQVMALRDRALSKPTA